MDCCGTLCIHCVDCWMNVTELLSAISQCIERIRMRSSDFTPARGWSGFRGSPTKTVYTLVPRHQHTISGLFWKIPKKGVNDTCCSLSGGKVDTSLLLSEKSCHSTICEQGKRMWSWTACRRQVPHMQGFICLASYSSCRLRRDWCKTHCLKFTTTYRLPIY